MAMAVSPVATDGLKRGLPENKPIQRTKKRKLRHDEFESGSEGQAGEDEDDRSSTASSHDSLEDHVATTGNTPLTPLSPAPTRVREKSVSQPPCRKQNLPCPYDSCNKFFNRRSRLEEHMRSHTNDRPFTCTYDPKTCNKTFLRQSHLTAHIKSAHTKSREFTCLFKFDPEDLHEKECGKAFATATKLRRHEKTHADGNARYRCTEHPPCKETFRKRATLAAHIKTAHLGVKPFICEMLDIHDNPCGAGYDTAFKLRAHERRAHTEEAAHQCLICSSEPSKAPKFRTQQELAHHTSMYHSPTCIECQTTFPTNAALSSHQTSAHPNSSLTSLPVNISYESQLLDPRRKHPCPYASECTKIFTTASNLRVHIRTMHERVKPFICGTTDLTGSKGLSEWDNAVHGCGAAFGVKSSLEKHVRVRHLSLPDPTSVKKRKQLQQTAQQGQNHEENEDVTESGTGLTANENRITQLLGSSETYNNRPIPCPIAQCNYKFFREHDMNVHYRLYHNSSASEGGATSDYDNLMNSDFVPRTTRNDVNDSHDHDNNSNINNDEEETALEHQALTGGPFWIGGLDESLDFTALPSQDFQQRQEEDIVEEGFTAVLDPLLL